MIKPTFPFPHPEGGGVTVVGINEVGHIAVTAEGFRFYLTPCCWASAKGSVAGGEPATVCRKCYEVVDDRLGDVPSERGTCWDGDR